jgi:hypothetical protein
VEQAVEEMSDDVSGGAAAAAARNSLGGMRQVTQRGTLMAVIPSTRGCHNVVIIVSIHTRVDSFKYVYCNGMVCACVFGVCLQF